MMNTYTVSTHTHTPQGSAKDIVFKIVPKGAEGFYALAADMIAGCFLSSFAPCLGLRFGWPACASPEPRVGINAC